MRYEATYCKDRWGNTYLHWLLTKHMHLPRFVSVFLTTLLLVSVINYSPNPTNKLADDNSNDYVLGQGKRSKSPVMLTANNDNYTLNESNQWLWLEFTASSDLAWVNLSFENYDSDAYGQSIYLQVFNHYSRCISSSVGVYSWATLNSLCPINSVDKTILILVDLSNNGNRDWDYGNVSISLNIESYQHRR